MKRSPRLVFGQTRPTILIVKNEVKYYKTPKQINIISRRKLKENFHQLLHTLRETFH